MDVSRTCLVLSCLLSAGGCHAAIDTRAIAETPGSPVVLVHGLARTSSSMRRLAKSLEQAGYRVCNIDYPSRQYAVENLASEHVLPAITTCLGDDTGPVHFVSHSMGGIIIRLLAAMELPFRIGRVVMLSPPNGGSEVVDRLGGLWLFRRINGPAGNQLGTGGDSVPNRLGPATFTVGIITGNRSINLFLSTIIPGDDDGKVSVDRARLDGMRDFLVVPATHPFIMKNTQVIAETLHFLRYGAFNHGLDNGSGNN